MTARAGDARPVAGAGGGRIAVLPEVLASKIAAGEVIERPASVVKELLENALDAGARRVTIELEEGGIALIRVRDDGAGMHAADAPLAFTRHATSKIRAEDDLLRIATLGFRGEALPSIAAVATVELTTRAGDAASGVRVTTAGGMVADVREAGAPPGTTVVVRELFAPVPARRKFLKTVATELGHIVDLVARQSLSAPEVHLALLHQGREIVVYPPVATLAERVRQVLGRERSAAGRPFTSERLGVAVEGFALSPHLSFASARHLYGYVNGRAVRDRGLQHAIVEGYASLIPRGRWPGAVVRVTVPAPEVDVNVHPAKHEVRFRLAHVVHDTVLGAVRRALAGTTGTRAAPVEPAGVAEALHGYAARQTREHAARLALAPRPGPVGGAAPTATVAPDGPAPAARAAAGFRTLRYVGQVFRGYLVCEGAERLVLVDQHAAHERVAFERLRAQHRTGAVERQRLLLPTTVELGPREAEALEHGAAQLGALGFDVEPFGERTFLVRAVPALLGGGEPRTLLEDLADGLASTGSLLPAHEALEAVLGRLACHGVVRVGRTLAAAEVDALLADLDALDHGSNCPHGRPVSVEFSRAQLERMFGR